MSNSIEVEVRRNCQQPWTYEDLDSYQRTILEEVLQGKPGRLLLSEVAPVITYGRRTPTSDHDFGGSVPRYPVDRGGLATYHGPGQWVLFPVENLTKLTGDSRGVRKGVNLLLNTALEVGRLYDPTAEIRQGSELGVWTSRGKFAAVGIHIQKGVLLHGLSLNGYRTATSFHGLRPCGLDAPVDFLLERIEKHADALEAEFLRLGEELVRVFLKRMRAPIDL
ncbi:MAG: hypothetical protein HYX41_05765 [Bdellovibrio sp.]|nr:hypothetical protein [Bdellovibrio sp.]